MQFTQEIKKAFTAAFPNNKISVRADRNPNNLVWDVQFTGAFDKDAARELAKFIEHKYDSLIYITCYEVAA